MFPHKSLYLWESLADFRRDVHYFTTHLDEVAHIDKGRQCGIFTHKSSQGSI